MQQLPVSPPSSQLPSAGASQAATSALSAEDGGGLEGSQGLSFGAVLGKQLKETIALRVQQDDAGFLKTSAESGEISDLAANANVPAFNPVDFIHQVSPALMPAAANVPAFNPVDFIHQASSALMPAASLLQPESGVGKEVSLGEVDIGKALVPLSHAGGTRLVAEIAADGKYLPQGPLSENNFSRKLALLVDGATDKVGAQLQSNDLSASVRHPVAGMVDTVAMPRPPEQMTVAARVGSAEWGGAVGERVLWMASQNNQVAELHLNPPSLGPLEVRLTINNDQATALFVSHHSAVREAIEAAMPRLREMLADTGIMLGNASVSAESFAQQQQAFERQGNKGNGSASVGGEGGGIVQMAGQALPAGSARIGMVDVFA